MAQHGGRGVIERRETRPGLHLPLRRQLRIEDDLVDVLLRRCEDAGHRDGAGDVGGVAAVVGGHVHVDHLPGLHEAVVLVVVQGRRVGAGPDDGSVTRPVGAVPAEGVLGERLDLELRQLRGDRVHGLDVRLGADLRRGAGGRAVHQELLLHHRRPGGDDDREVHRQAAGHRVHVVIAHELHRLLVHLSV